MLANLPRTRPQRATARRTAARSAKRPPPRSAASRERQRRAPPARSKRKPAAAEREARGRRPNAAAAQSGAREARTQARGARRSRGRATSRSRSARPGPVQPPGGTELVGTAAEIVSEIAKAGISGGERLLRDVLSRPRPLSRTRRLSSPFRRNLRQLRRGFARRARRTPDWICILPPTPSCCDSGRGRRGTQLRTDAQVRWGESVRKGRSAARSSAARARQLTP